MNNAARVLQAPEPDGGFGHRLISAGAEDMLERFSDPKLLAAGKANVISLEAVQNRFGARWELRRDQVYSFTERVLERGVGDSGFLCASPHRISCWFIRTSAAAPDMPHVCAICAR